MQKYSDLILHVSIRQYSLNQVKRNIIKHFWLKVVKKKKKPMYTVIN